MDFRYILYIVFGVLPSLTWLFYYLRKDDHPESARNIIRIFIWGALITLPVFFSQLGLAYLLGESSLPPFVVSLIYWFLVISLTEEVFKYLVIRTKVRNHYEMDEPLDIMLYMIISALGFSALENVLYLFSPVEGLSFNDVLNRTLMISFIRFIGATFLHTLCSGIFGYFIALSFRDAKNRLWLFLFGLLFATLLHGLYDFSIMTVEGPLKVAIPAGILIVLAGMVIAGFEKLKKVKSVCLVT